MSRNHFDAQGDHGIASCAAIDLWNSHGLGQSASKGMKAGAAMSRISMKINPPIAVDVTLINAKGFC